MKEHKDGYKMTEIGVLPEDWDVKELGSICMVITKGTTPSTYGYGFLGDGINFVKIESINDSYGVFQPELFSKISEECHTKLNRSILENQDILFAIAGATVGKCAMIGQEQLPANTNQALAIIRLNKSENKKFVFHQLRGPHIQKKINQLKTNTAQPNLNLKQISQFKLAYPSKKDEQSSIAEILSVADNHLEKLDAIITDNQLLKKAMMRSLLTRGIGHTEFKDSVIGQIPKVWEVKRLKEICKNKGEYGIGSKAVEYVKNKPRYLRITDFDECGRLVGDLKSIAEEDYKRYILKKDDLVFARTGNTTGKSYLYREKDGELVFAGFLIKFSIDSSKAKSEFIKYCCQTKAYWDWVKMSSTRSGQPGLNSNQYSNLELPLPPLLEQQRIVEILSAIDDRIQLYEKEKADFTELKKGLMEELLTGKIRVNNQV